MPRPFTPALLSILPILALAACKPEPPTGTTEGTEGTGTTDDTGGPTTDAPTTGTPTTGTPQDGWQEFEIADSRDVDILFVIDNSGSMARPQSRLAQSAAALFGVLGAPDLRANVRVGVTTTDSGNPRCPNAQVTPEGGRLVLSSCIDRVQQGEFTFNMSDFSSACTDACTLSDADLPITPTTTDFSGGQAEPRKWIQSIEGTTNLPEGVSMAQAFQCFAPQGVAGCGFESHLESMYRALAQSSREDSPTNYGFVRDAASLAIVIVSDETDCSASNIGGDIFTTNKVYWNDPADPAPTSAVCWRAGVTCDGPGPIFTACDSSNHDLEGNADVPDDQAVLQPLAKYVDFVQGIENQKKQRFPDIEVLVTLFTGVPEGYEDGQSELVYEDSADVDFQSNFGIGPGCLDADPDPFTSGAAVPPVREREFAEAFQVGQERALSSICAPDYAASLQRLGERIAAQIRPSCIPKCLADTDPGTPIVEPNCEVEQEVFPDDAVTSLLPCVVVGDAFVPPAAETACFGLRVDQENLTPSSLDDMHPQCIAEGYNAELVILRTAPAPTGATIRANCQLSPNALVDCPNL